MLLHLVHLSTIICAFWYYQISLKISKNTFALQSRTPALPESFNTSTAWVKLSRNMIATHLLNLLPTQHLILSPQPSHTTNRHNQYLTQQLRGPSRASRNSSILTSSSVPTLYHPWFRQKHLRKQARRLTAQSASWSNRLQETCSPRPSFWSGQIEN